MTKRHVTTIATLDGLRLAATFVEPEQATGQAVVLVHGGGVTREEGGFFTRLADGLAEAGVASLRFDLRGHGESEGKMEDLTLAAVLNDIRMAIAQVRETTGAASVSLLGASFGGGICAYYAAKHPSEIERLVLLNPQFNYKRRTIDNTPFWENEHLKPEAAVQLSEQGYIAFNPSIRHGRAIFNEVFWFDVEGRSERSQPRRCWCTVRRTPSFLSSRRWPHCPCSRPSIGSCRSKGHSTDSRCMRTRSTSTPEPEVASLRHPDGGGVDHGGDDRLTLRPDGFAQGANGRVVIHGSSASTTLVSTRMVRCELALVATSTDWIARMAASSGSAARARAAARRAVK